MLNKSENSPSNDHSSRIFECTSISNHGDSRNASFSHQKSGFVRLKKDILKFAYVLELYASSNKQNESIKKPNLTVLLEKGTKIDSNKEKIIVRAKQDGVTHLIVKSETDREELVKLLNKCLADENLSCDSFLTTTENSTQKNENETSQTTLTNSNNNNKPSNCKNIIADLKGLTESKQSPTILMPNKPRLFNPALKKSPPQTAATNESSTTTHQPIFGATRNFYSTNNNNTSNNSTANSQIFSLSYKQKDKENDCSSSSTRHKRRHSPIENDENSENRNTTQHHIQFTPKRNCFDNQRVTPSPNSLWNRSSSNLNRSAGKGFSNLGNTCYMNAILQCLLNIDSFSIDLLINKQQLKDTLPKSCLYNALCDLYKTRETSNSDYLQIQALKDVKNAISQEATRFSGHQQHDAHEFLCQVLDQLKEDVDKIIKKQNEQQDEPQQQQQQQQQQQSQIINNNNSDSVNSVINPVVENFEFQVTHTIQCTKCPETITKKEEFNNLCLELPTNLIKLNDLHNNVSLQDTLDIFFRDEHVNEFNCEKCNNSGVTIKHKFKKLPRVLILYLKRYQFEDGFNLIKNDCNVDITKYLTLNWLCESEDNIELPSKQTYSESLVPPLTPISNKILSSSNHQNISTTTTAATSNQLTTTNSVLGSASSSALKQLNQNNISSGNKRTPFNNLLKTTQQQNSPQMNKSKINRELNFNDSINQRKRSTTTSDFGSDIEDVDGFDDFSRNAREREREQQNEKYNYDPLTNIDDVEFDTTSSYIKNSSSSKFGLYNNKDQDNQPLPALYDEQHFVLKGMSEDDQLNLALSMSLENNSNNNQKSSLMTTDDDFTLNTAHFVDGTIDDDDIDKELGEAFAHEFIDKSKILYTYDPKKRSNLEDHEKNVDQLIEKIHRSDSFCGEDSRKEANLDEFKLNRSEEQLNIIKENSNTGKEPNSYRIIGIVSHLGYSSNSGHYICDAYNLKTKTWSSYDDKKVEILSESDVLKKRAKTGYIFFYIHNSMESKSN